MTASPGSCVRSSASPTRAGRTTARSITTSLRRHAPSGRRTAPHTRPVAVAELAARDPCAAERRRSAPQCRRPTRAAALSLSSSHARPSHTRCSMAAVAPRSTCRRRRRRHANVRTCGAARLTAPRTRPSPSRARARAMRLSPRETVHELLLQFILVQRSRDARARGVGCGCSAATCACGGGSGSAVGGRRRDATSSRGGDAGPVPRHAGELRLGDAQRVAK